MFILKCLAVMHKIKKGKKRKEGWKEGEKSIQNPEKNLNKRKLNISLIKKLKTECKYVALTKLMILSKYLLQR